MRTFPLALFVFFILCGSCFIRSEDELPVDEEQKVAPAEEAPQENNAAEAEALTPDAPKEENDVLILTTDNFDSYVNDKSIVLVEFYAPWCGHCKSLAPEYEKAAKVLKTTDPVVPLAKVDATVESSLGQRFDVQGYPTLKIFRKGVPYDYDGPRKEQGIIDYMKEQSDPNWQPPKEEVIVLTKDNFTEITTREEIMLVEFYAPWCGHCKRLAPTYEKAAKTLKALDPPILLAKVDATVDTELATEYKIGGYPTLKLFRKGKAYDYKGETSNENAIVSYMEDQSGLSSKLHATYKEAKAFSTSSREDIVILGLFKDENDPMFQTYLDANNDIRIEYEFGHTFDQKIRSLFGVKESAIVVIHPKHLVSKYEKPHYTLTKQDATAEDMTKFYEEHKAPLVGHFQGSTEKRFSKRPLLLVFYDVNFDHEYMSMTQFWRNKVVEIAKDYPDIQFAVADEENSNAKLKELGLAESGEDVNVGLYDKDGRKYAMNEEFSDDAVREFIQAFKDGELSAIVKSQPKPKSNNGPVKIVVGDTFDSIVMDKSKNVMFEIYAPWCGHCKSLEPIYKKLGKKYEKNDSVVISKMDGTANDLPLNFKVEGFPTIYWVPVGSKNTPMKYEGARTLEGMANFIDEYLKTSTEEKTKDEL